jgi:hypothetical protein
MSYGFSMVVIGVNRWWEAAESAETWLKIVIEDGREVGREKP